MKKPETNSHFYQMKIFTGKEVEGPDRGKRTLFIPKNSENRKDFLKLAEKYNCKRLYFGAGNDRGIHKDIIDQIYLIPDDYEIIIEITNIGQISFIDENLFPKINLVFVIFRDSWYPISTIKVETPEEIHWLDLKKSTVSNINDGLYKEDKEA